MLNAWRHSCQKVRRLFRLSYSYQFFFAVPGKRYALTLQLMLKRAKKRKASQSRSPKMPREAQVHRPTIAMVVENQVAPQPHPRHQETFSASYEQVYPAPDVSSSQGPHLIAPPMAVQHTGDVDNIWRGFEMTSNEQLPVWLSDQSLGGHSFQQNGMDAFLLPNDYLPPATQIW